MDQTRAENAVREMLEAVREELRCRHPEAFDVTGLVAEPGGDDGGRPNCKVRVTLSVVILANYAPFVLPHEAAAAPPFDPIDRSNRDDICSAIEARVAARRITPYAMARSLRWGAVTPDEPELKQHPDDDDPCWTVPFSLVVTR